MKTVKGFKRLLKELGLLSREPGACAELIAMFEDNHDAAINATWRLYDKVYFGEQKGDVIMKWELLAKDIYDWCKANNVWEDTIIYFDGKAWSTDDEWSGVNGKEIEDGLYEYCNKNPLNYFVYANPETLSMSFEGSLYEILNGYSSGWVRMESEFIKLFEKYGCYYELGHAWNLSVYQ